MKIAMIVSDNAIIEYNAQLISDNFRKIGCDTIFLDLSNDMTEIINVLRQEIDFAMTFNNNGIDLTCEDGNVWDLLGIPIVNYLFDHPMYYFMELETAPSQMILTCVDQNHVRFVERFIPNVSQVYFVPLAGEMLDGDKIPWEDRSISVLYVGSLKTRGDEYRDPFFDYVVEFMKGHSYYATEQAIERCFKECPEEVITAVLPQLAGVNRKNAPDDLIGLIIVRYRDVDTVVNAYYREKMLRTLLEAGIDVEVYGDWGASDLVNNPHGHFHGFITHMQCIEKMRNTKFVLNSMPWFKNGSHDRVYNAMLQGAICITDHSDYIDGYLLEGVDCAYVDLDELDIMPNIVNFFMENPEAANEMTANAYVKVAERDTWEMRCKMIVDFLSNN